VPTVEQAGAVLDAAGSGAEEEHPLALRDLLVLELLYATGVRVAELCGLDLDDVDPSRRALRVIGKGDRERTVVYGVPASDALRPWLAPARLPRSCSAPVVAGSTRGWRAASSTRPSRPCPARPMSGHTASATPQPLTCCRAARTSVTYRNCSVTLS
jgi:site-specific recombinase XerC